MAGELLIFDAAASNVDGTDPGTALNLGPGTNYGIREFDAPAPPQTVQWAGSVDTEGSLPSSRKHENRVITMKILCVTAASLRSLQDKVGKVGREGGTLKWVLPNAETIIFDLHSADTFAPAITKLLYVRSGAFCEVAITLLAKPYGRGAEVDLGDNVETTLPCIVFTDTGVKGDVPGLGRLLIDNDEASANLSWLTWGIQSRRYDSDVNAALFFQAEDGSAVNATAAAGPAGASGSTANKVMQHLNVGVTGDDAFWIGTGSQSIEHVGSFRVYVRAWADTANTGIVSSRVKWYANGSQSSISVSNDWTPMVNLNGTAQKNAWYLVDLGLVSAPVARVGTQQWSALVQSKSTVSTDDVYYDCVFLVPVNEGSGIARDSSLLLHGKSVQIDDRGIFRQAGGGSWPIPTSYEGNYLLIPPAGAEARTVRMIVVPVDGSITANPAVMPFSTISDVSAHLYYTPRYLVVPTP